MEAFEPLPVDFFSSADGLIGGNEEDSSTYFSLSQFDLELQQQAQQALLQSSSINNDWQQDFDKYLPVDSQLFRSNNQAQPIFNNNSNNNGYNDATTLLYEPLSDLLPPQPSLPPQQHQHIINSSDSSDRAISSIKQEYASPESLPYSPTQSATMTTNEEANPHPELSPKNNSNSTTPTLNLQWPSNNTSVALDSNNYNFAHQSNQSQAKLPIQRLKSINTTNSANIINNAVNAALNSSNNLPVGRQLKKTAHNAIERRYRNNINDRIAELKNAVPALLYAKVKDHKTGSKRRADEDDDENDDGEEFLDGVAVATKLNKATILRKATEYINHLKMTAQDVKHENQTLQNILTQLPGGADILKHYHHQKSQREKEMHQQQVLERELQKQQEQRRKSANRKRAKQQQQHQQQHEELYESSGSSPSGSHDGPLTPPQQITSRLFMAVFMCITFFSTNPLTAGPSSSEQYQNHHHASRSASVAGTNDQPTAGTTNTAASPNMPLASSSTFSSLFSFNDGWSAIRTIVFAICIIQLFFPYIKSFLFSSSTIKPKRTNNQQLMLSSSYTLNNKKRIPRTRKTFGHQPSTPGDLKCRQVYSILEKSIFPEQIPRSTISTVFLLIKESICLFSRHMLGYEIMTETGYEDSEAEVNHVYKWVKINETSCLLQPRSKLTMIYACFRMINLVDTMQERHDDIYARAYATASIQTLLCIPRRVIANRLSNYFWQQVLYSEDEEEDEHVWLQALYSIDPDQDIESIEEIRQSNAWSETIQVFSSKSTLSVSYTAPIIVPAALLSTLHLLDNLRIQFDRLVSSMSSPGEQFETAFHDIMILTEYANSDNELDQQRLANWFATVGLMTEFLWKNNIEAAEKYLPNLVQRVPLSVTCRAKSVTQKADLQRLDGLVKKTIIHLLVGSILLKSEEESKKAQGLTELENAETLRTTIRKLQAKIIQDNNDGSHALENDDLESSVLALAEFVVSLVGLEAWIVSYKLDMNADKEIFVDEQVHESTVFLRRMIRHPALMEHEDMVARLSKLGRYIARQVDDVDSACDMSDDELNSRSQFHLDSILDDGSDHKQVLAKRADKAQLILHGLA